MQSWLKNRFNTFFFNEKHIAPLAIFRITFGSILFISLARFLLKRWVTEFYVKPRLFFPFYGFEWLKPLDSFGMHIVFFLMVLASLFVLLGLFYRISTFVFFFSFSYVELLDKTNYLNHYYFITIITFLLILVPAHRFFSLDVLRKPSLKINQVPSWTINIFILQLLLVYLFSGISKLNYDWLIEAMPLRIWLPAMNHLPVIGSFLNQEWTAYLFSWAGMLFDLCIGFLLLNKKTNRIAYFFVIIFHVLTGLLFKIGMFPYIMICSTIIFFPEKFHIRRIQKFQGLFSKNHTYYNSQIKSYHLSPIKERVLYLIIIFHFSLQLLLPFRYLLYPGKLYWTEEGYRFSWRVMLMEKGGTAFFYVTDSKTGKKSEVINSEFLTPLQEKMMATQPDMILQYAHFLKKEYLKRGVDNPLITADGYVTLNGSGSRAFIDSRVNLAAEVESFAPKKWILPFEKK